MSARWSQRQIEGEKYSSAKSHAVGPRLRGMRAHLAWIA